MKAALFDLDGVVFDTEPQYTVFWGGQCRLYHPEILGLEHKIKGQTLPTILGTAFGDVPCEHEAIVERLDDFEQHMCFDFVPGFTDYIHRLRDAGILTAVVTSSNDKKMQAVYKQHPQFRDLFDLIITSDDIHEGKPSPECYLTAAGRLGVEPEDCVVFEDSINGLKSGRAASMYVIGLATTNPADVVCALSDRTITDFTEL